MMVMYVYSHNASIFPADLGCQQNTNVVKFYSLLKKDDESDEQLCYYQVCSHDTIVLPLERTLAAQASIRARRILSPVPACAWLLTSIFS